MSFVELGAALTAFNVISAAMQTPAGFLVDKVSARAVLVGGLLLGAGALAGASLAPTFWVFVAMFAFLGLANTVYHPADYALLSHRISAARMSKAYSIHTFSGILGSAVAPASLSFLALSLRLARRVPGRRHARLRGGGALDARRRRDRRPRRAAAACQATRPAAAEPTWRLLLTPAILLNLVFFFMLSLANGGVQNYSVVALEALRGTPYPVANVGLSAYLLLSAFGVLVGGYAAANTSRHDGIVIAALAANALAVLAIALFDLPTPLLILLMSAAGLFQGLAMPSRDMLVRAVTPPGAFGKVFGFVTTGFNIAGMVAPLIFGWMMDQGNPQAVLLASAAFGLATIPTVMLTVARR